MDSDRPGYLPPWRIIPQTHVAVPCYATTAAICLVSFGSFIGQGTGQGLIRTIGVSEGAYIDRARNDLVRQALANDSTHLFFVDQDMIIPEYTLRRFLLHNVDIIGGTYFGKDDFFTPVAFHLDPFDRVYEFDDLPMFSVDSEKPEDEDFTCVCGKPDDHIHEVGGTGMGCTMITTKLLRAMDEKFEDGMWFSSKETGEDVHFANRANEMGVTRYIDGFVQCGHIRSHMVTRQNYDWVNQQGQRCGIPDCDRLGRYDVGDGELRCGKHKEDGTLEDATL